MYLQRQTQEQQLMVVEETTKLSIGRLLEAKILVVPSPYLAPTLLEYYESRSRESRAGPGFPFPLAPKEEE